MDYDDYLEKLKSGVSVQIVGAGWVLALKPDGSVRSRCVCTQVKYGSELDSFAATPTVIAQRIWLLKALEKEWKVRTAAVSVAFLHSHLPEGEWIYVRPPATEISKKGIPKEKLLWRLKKVLYGLRQAPKFFQEFSSETLESLGWRRLKAEPQLWAHDNYDGALLLAHVDDLLLTAGDEHHEKIQKELDQKMKTKWGDYITEKWAWYLGFEWRRFGGRSPHFELRTREEYIIKTLEECGLQRARTMATPFGQEEAKQVPKIFLTASAQTQYRRTMGQLMWILPSRPDIAFTVKELARAASSRTARDE